MNESMDHLRDEMAKRHDHPGIQAVGEYLCRRLEDDAEIGRIAQMLDSYMEAQQDFMEEGGLLGD